MSSTFVRVALGPRRRRVRSSLRMATLALGLTTTPALARAAEPDDSSVDELRPPSIPSKRLSLHFGYYGEFAFHPGGFAGVEFIPVANRRWELLVTGNVASYVHLRNHVGLELYPELGARLRLGRRVGLELLGGVGYLHTFLAGPVYEVDDRGVVERVRDPGRAAVMPTASLGLSVATKRVSPFFRIQTFGQYPFNDSMLVHVAVLVGVRL